MLDQFADDALIKTVVLVIISTLGSIETLKTLITLPTKKLWALGTLFVSGGYAFLFVSNGPELGWIEIAIIAWSLTQLTYDIILRTLRNVIDKIDGKIDEKD
jgi:hypothetical protein